MFHLIWNRRGVDDLIGIREITGPVTRHQRVLTVGDRGGLTPTQTDLFGRKKCLSQYFSRAKK